MTTESKAEHLHISLQRRYVAHVGLIIAIVGVLAVYLLNLHWPYRYRNVKPMLESVFASKITIGHYQRLYFPGPGFEADDLTLRRDTAPNLPPVGSIDHVRVSGRWIDLLMMRKEIRLVQADGLHVVIPPVGSEANRRDFPKGSSADFTGPDTAVERLDIHNALLDIMRTDGSRYSFPIWHLIVGNLRKGGAVSFYLKMRNAIPTGDIEAHGDLGPIIPKDLAQTPVSGTFTFTSVRLNSVNGLQGTGSAQGNFRGQFGGIEITAKGSVPDFAVQHGRPVQIVGTATGAVNALNGNIELQAVDLHTGRTDVHAQGTIAGMPKLTNLEIAVKTGRAEDILRPFMSSTPPVTGAVQLHSRATLSPAAKGRDFLQRLTMRGSFDIPEERVTNPNTAKSLTAFSERAQGGHTPASQVSADELQAISSLAAAVSIRNGIVHANQLTFALPGALVRLTGDFDLRTRVAKLQGDMRMQADVSHVTTGVKSVLLKAFAPFFKKKHAGAQVPISVTGYPGHYKVTQNIVGHHG